MSTILVVDDMAIFRDPIAACLQQAGYKTHCAANGEEALAAMRASSLDLVLLDVAMPGMDGLTLVRRMRKEVPAINLPIILLTAMADKKLIVQAAELGVRDYLLKSRFSLPELLARVKKLLGTTTDAKTENKPGTNPTATSPAAAPPGAHGSPPQLLTRENCLQQAREAVQAKSLSGVVAQVIQSATSPHTDTSQIAQLIARDPMLSAKLLHLANSAVYASNRGPVTNIAEAIKKIGFSTVRNIASTVGIFEAMSAADGTGFNPIRCWQHSFAVAQLSERLAASGKGVEPAVAYLAGLCHDLGEVLVRTRFAKEYQQVVETQARTGESLSEVERAVLGVSHPELMSTILDGLGLPAAIRAPIEALHAAAGGAFPNNPTAQIVFMADRYANGMLLASSEESPLQGLPQTDCRLATGNPKVPVPERVQFRAEIFALTGFLSRMDDARLSAPLFPSSKKKIFLARDTGLCKFDPIEAALESLGKIVVQDRLPTVLEAKETDFLVVAARTSSAAALSAREIAAVSKDKPIPTFWMVGQVEEADSKLERPPRTWPVPLDSLAKFVQGKS